MTEALAETVLQMGMTKLPAVTQLRGTHFSITHFIPSLRVLQCENCQKLTVGGGRSAADPNLTWLWLVIVVFVIESSRLSQLVKKDVQCGLIMFWRHTAVIY